jgi:ABC-type transport system involved in cytochrome c biogenesis permease subunit
MLAEQVLLVTGAVAFGAFVLCTITSHKRIAGYCAYVGCGTLIAVLALRWYGTGHPPWTALYETAALLALLSGIVAMAAVHKDEPAPFSIALAGLSALLAALSGYLWQPAGALPISLDSGWLLIHVPVVICAYGLFAVSAMAAIAYIYLKIKGRGGDMLERLDRTSFRTAMGGLFLLVVGTILGAFWAYAAWGSYWSWDPKETWALITILVYALYAGLRWRGLKAEDAAYLSLLGFLAVIFTYLGVSYLIPGLHSYA